MVIKRTYLRENVVPGSESSRELSFPGAKVPREHSFPGAKVLSGNFRSEERKYRGAKSPWTLAIRLSSYT